MLINPTKEVVMNTKRFMLLSAVLDGFLEDANMAANRETFLWYLRCFPFRPECQAQELFAAQKNPFEPFVLWRKFMIISIICTGTQRLSK